MNLLSWQKQVLLLVRKVYRVKLFYFEQIWMDYQFTKNLDVSFQSTHKGNMHACGHDGHMAMMLSFASYCSTLSNLKKTIVMIFQPAEEGPGGASVMIEEGLFEMFHITACYGIHLYPGLEEGLYGLTPGPMMAQNAEFDISITGKSAHGGQPHQGIDAYRCCCTFGFILSINCQ